jgi:thiamine-phosphate pyrophosphorylase
MKLPRVYPILDTASLARAGVSSVTAAQALLEGGARILQFRHKDFWSRQIFEEARQIAALCSSAGALFVVNDRADYARLLATGCPVLHLGQEDLTPQDARIVVGNDAIIGFSTHNEEQMRAALSQPIDYVAFGPVFPTASKVRPDPTVGTQLLSEIRNLVRNNGPSNNIPLVAIGGITRETAALCWRAGADSVAVIADLYPASPTKQSIRERMVEWDQLTKQ